MAPEIVGNMRKSITVNDRMQRDYRYELVRPVGRNFDPEFKPDLTPAEMLRLRVFGGKYTNAPAIPGNAAVKVTPQTRSLGALRRVSEHDGAS